MINGFLGVLGIFMKDFKSNSVMIKAMLQRFAIRFALIFLFAFTQIGAVAHEISHLNDFTKHSQQDKKAPAEQCGKCISFSQVVSSLQSQAFVLPSAEAGFEAASNYYFNVQSLLLTAYAARAPPQIDSIQLSV